MKVRNLKANHNDSAEVLAAKLAVLACVKVRNLKANHNEVARVVHLDRLY